MLEQLIEQIDEGKDYRAMLTCACIKRLDPTINLKMPHGHDIFIDPCTKISYITLFSFPGSLNPKQLSELEDCINLSFNARQYNRLWGEDPLNTVVVQKLICSEDGKIKVKTYFDHKSNYNIEKKSSETLSHIEILKTIFNQSADLKMNRHKNKENPLNDE